MKRNISLCCDEIAVLIPGQAQQIRETALKNLRFREICEDYGEAILAATNFREGKDGDVQRSREYENMAKVFLEEALAHLELSQD